MPLAANGRGLRAGLSIVIMHGSWASHDELRSPPADGVERRRTFLDQAAARKRGLRPVQRLKAREKALGSEKPTR